MSTIVAICCTGFCMMMSDSRRMINVGGKSPVWEFEDDSTQKIFKLNDDVLFGGVGRFWKNKDSEEEIAAPIDGRSDVSLYDAIEMTERYMMDNIHMVDIYPRRYLLAGREENDKYILVSVDYNSEKHGIERTVYRPRVDGEFATLLALPRSFVFSGIQSEASRRLAEIVRTAKSDTDIILHTAELIKWIGENDIDNSVGGEIKYLLLS